MQEINFTNMSDMDIVPITKELTYQYDYGDGWEVVITISDEEYTEKDITYVKENYMPLCIKKDGLSVLDDVGGEGGYCDFLTTVHEAEEEEREEMKAWARYLTAFLLLFDENSKNAVFDCQ